MVHMTRLQQTLIVLLACTTVTACGKKATDQARTEKIVNVTSAKVIRKDLPVTESAVGAETGVGMAESYDPTHAGSREILIRLPYPIHIAQQLHKGQRVTLNNFGEVETVTGSINAIRPALDTTTQTREVIVRVEKAGRWLPRGSVRGEVVLNIHVNALVVPETSLVIRPAGTVAYVIQGDAVRERVVKTGLERKGVVEILSGLEAGETVANDGAALLSEGGKVKVQGDTP